MDVSPEYAVTTGLLFRGLVTTVIAIAASMAGRYFLIRLVKGKAEILDKDQRRWINRINNGTTILVLVCLVFIWAPQLHTFALSLTAIAVAVVLTTKEILMCLTGGFLRASTKPFDIGDWIRVGDLTGEVMRVTALATTVQEIDTSGGTYQFTGRSVQIPNSKFLSENVENAEFLKDYLYHDVPITADCAGLDPADLMAELQRIAETHFAPLRSEAIDFNKAVEKKSAVDFADPEPQFFIKTTDVGHVTYTVRIFAPTKQAAHIGTNLTRDFISHVYDAKHK